MRAILAIVLGVAISVVLLTGCNSNDSVSSKGLSPAPGNLSTQTPGDGVRRITVTELKDAVDKGAVLIVDTRGPEAYAQDHIKGSINILEANLDAHMSELPHDKMIVTYCSWPSEHTSASLARKLMTKGFNNVAALLGGTEAWKRAGLPMESGSAK